MVTRTLTYNQALELGRNLAHGMMMTGIELGISPPYKVYGIPRGGVMVAYMLLSSPNCRFEMVDNPEDAHFIVDDIVDSGQTMLRYTQFRKPICALVSRNPSIITGEVLLDEDWVVFPWEISGPDDATDIPRRMLQYIGENTKRPGLIETPQRVVKAWGEWFSGYGADIASIFKTFEDGAENVDEVVLLTDIPVFSHCEHHIAPFMGVAHVAYIPNGKIVGLSKIARLVDVYSRRLQVQERLTNQIADAMVEHLKPIGVAVVIKAQHTCMSTRGAKVHGVDTTTSALRGVMHDEPSARAEFFSLIRGV